MARIEGVITGIEEPKILKEGTTKSGKPWKLLGTKITVDGQEYGITDFSSANLNKILEGIALRDKVSFEYELNGEFKNILKEKEIKVLENMVPQQEGEKKSFSQSKDSYWADKFEYDKQRDALVQKSIRRGNAWEYTMMWYAIVRDKMAGDVATIPVLKKIKDEIEADLNFEEIKKELK